MNKKGSSVDNLFAAVSFFCLAIFFLVILVAWGSITGIPGFWSISTTATTVQTNMQSAVSNFDFIIVLAYVGMHLGIIVLSFLLRTHPVVYIGAIVVLALLTLVSAPLSNAYDDIITDTAISTAASSIPMTNFIMYNLPTFEVIFGLISAVVLFGFARSENIV